jgi:hypothetical protein
MPSTYHTLSVKRTFLTGHPVDDVDESEAGNNIVNYDTPSEISFDPDCPYVIKVFLEDEFRFRIPFIPQHSEGLRSTIYNNDKSKHKNEQRTCWKGN